jgi:hypothetical protein
VIPAGFAGRMNLTVPLATLLGLAERPGEIPSIGPIDPALARDLATATARNPKTTWCLTVTNELGQATCRHDHRLKQHPRWKVEQITPAVIQWTTPSGRQYTTEPTRYPI